MSSRSRATPINSVHAPVIGAPYGHMGRIQLGSLEDLRLRAGMAIDPARRATLGQFFTPGTVAVKMASMLSEQTGHVHILDAGAGSGILFGSVVVELLARARKPTSIHVTAYEIDPRVATYARQSLELCTELCAHAGVNFTGTVLERDFIEDAVSTVARELFGLAHIEPVTIAVMNPPYRKIRTDSRERKLLRRAGIEETNLYTGFLSLALNLLSEQGELVAITPRSFCNGTYFRAFRKRLDESMSLKRLHLFAARDTTFASDDVLQETVILNAIKTRDQSSRQSVLVSVSDKADEMEETARLVPYHHVLKQGDPNSFISIPAESLDSQATALLDGLPCSLSDLGIEVSTGKVVEFRTEQHHTEQTADGAAPLITPRHMVGGGVTWPVPRSHKPEALRVNPASRKWLIPSGCYPLVKRLTAKEEQRRVVAAVCDGAAIGRPWLAIENHVNYFHRRGEPLNQSMAYGLVAYLNSTLVDLAVRQFNGHTQVNATDLRALRYPLAGQLEAIGLRVITENPQTQSEIDHLIQEVVGIVDDSSSLDPIAARARIEEARALLKDLGLPGAQTNERSALTLLALLNLTPHMPWAAATNPHRGVTQMMAFFSQHYGKAYAPNTRETVRRQTLHQFLDLGLVRLNPDDPRRPINSGQTVYQIEDQVMTLLHQFGGPSWAESLVELRRLLPERSRLFANERFIARIPIRISSGGTLTISPGGQNVLVEKIVHDFAERFIPNGQLLYLGDAENKLAYLDHQAFAALGVTLDSHGKAPDVIIHNEADGWLGLIEAVTSHGPIGDKRKAELERMFSGCVRPLVFVTAFLNRRSMVKYMSDIAWETEVWIADAPDHLIHFDGQQGISPYSRTPRQASAEQEEES